jgi:hypothetical protein
VRILRLLLTVLYASYLVNAGILLVMLPWSDAWPRLILLVPMRLAVVLDNPGMRGLLTAFGALHLLLLVAEFLQPTLWTPSQRKDLM